VEGGNKSKINVNKQLSTTGDTTKNLQKKYKKKNIVGKMQD